MTRRLYKFLRRLYHYAVYVAGGAVIAVCIVALAFKFWVMPNISGYQGMLEDAASKAVGQPVRIGALEADWHGVNPRVVLRDVRMTPPVGAPLVLPRVEAVLSWLSLPLLDARLARLNLERPRLAAHRDAAGVIFVAGIPVNVPGTPSPFPDWLLKQPRIVVKDAEITWLDAKLDAPELRLTGVRLLVQNRFGRHRFGGIAQPSAAAARRLEVRGDFTGRSVHDWQSWSGEGYARVDDARFESWGQWVPWAQDPVKRGVGSLRFWLDLEQGVVNGLSGDARLNQVAISLQQDLPDMRFDSLSGHVGWNRDEDRHSFLVDKLRFRLPGAEPAEPASVRVELTPDGQGGAKRIGVTASNLRLEAFTALTGAIPLPRRGHDLIESLNPRGLVESAEGHWAGKKDYALKLKVRDAGVRPYQNLPGISGLSARIRANQDEGQAELEGRDLVLDWPQVFRQELSFTRLDATAGWHAKPEGLQLAFDVARVSNPDLDGTAQGSLDLPGTGAPRIDLKAHLSRGEAMAVHRYLPRKVAETPYQWLKRGLVGGRSDDVRLTLKGPLDRFPFDKGGGEFRVSVNMLDGALDYAPGWPRIERVRGQLLFHGMAMSIDADSGAILDTRLGPVKVHIPDLHYTYDETVFVDGRASGETRAFLDFIRRSPVDEYTGGFTAPFQATGQGSLALSLRIPVRNVDATTVSGNFAFQDNRLEPGGDLPVLDKLNGVVGFTDKELQARAVRVQILDQPALLNIGSAPGGQLHVTLTGRATADSLRPHLPAPLAGRISGATDWRADIGLNASRKTELTLTSNLAGMAVDLPAPLGKSASQPVALSLSMRPGANGQEEIVARHGELLSLRALLPDEAPARVTLRLGPGEAPAPSEDGLWVSGILRSLDLDAWRRLNLQPGGGNGLPLREASVTFNELRALNRRLRDTHVRLQPLGNGWNITMAGREITGDISTVPETGGFRLLANLKRLAIPEPEPGAGREATEQVTGLRYLDLNAGSLAWKGIELGELRMRLSPGAKGLQVDNFRIINPDARLEGKGTLSDHPRRPTRLEVKLETANLGKLLAQLGSPGRVKGGATQIAGNLGWLGGLEDFDLGTLNGDLNLAVKQGQFLKVDPGAAKLLGILSLQALPRRVALDFRDVFTEGFAFDEIAGDVYLDRGSAYTRELRMNGPAAKIRMSGVVDLDNETQNLRLQIQPRLEDTVAVAGALIGGPAVGLGTLIASKVLKDPLGQAVTFEYTVTGNWSEPVITKIPRRPPKGAENP